MQGGIFSMKKEELIYAIGNIEDEMIEKSENCDFGKIKRKTAVLLAAALVIVFSVTAVAAAKFANTMSGGRIVNMEAFGGYAGDCYEVSFEVDAAADAGYEITEFCVPMYLEENENWEDRGGEAFEDMSIMCWDYPGKTWFAIFQQFPVKSYSKGAKQTWSAPAGSEFIETEFEVDGSMLYCIETFPHDDGFTGDLYGTKHIFWSDGYSLFRLEVYRTTDEETVKEIIRSVKPVEDISDYVRYKR